MSSRSVRCAWVLAVTAPGCAAPPPPWSPESPPVAETQRVGAGAPAPPACTVDHPEGLAGCVDTERIRSDLEAITGMRPPGSMHWSRVQRRCADVLDAAGFEVALHDFGDGVNVWGTRVGMDPRLPAVMVGAHYDHIPGCVGADDNASGVAGLLEVARLLGPTPTARTLVVACWDREEDGLLGSRAWVNGPMKDVGAPGIYVNFDAIGFVDRADGTQRVPTGFGLLFPGPVLQLAERNNRADFIAVVTDEGAAPVATHFAQHAATIDLPTAVLKIPTVVKDSHIAVDLQRSDHASFWNAGVPAIMITDTADFRSDAYHCRGREDALDTLDIGFVRDVVRATVFAVATAAADD